MKFSGSSLLENSSTFELTLTMSSKLLLSKLMACASILIVLSLFNAVLAQEDFDETGPDALIIYDVRGDTLLNPQENPAAATDAELEDVMLDRAYHEVLWQDFTELIPLRYRTSITRLSIYTDGEDGILASVTPNPDNFDTWTLALDALDGTYMSDDLIHTLIHEFGHILTPISRTGAALP